MQKDLIHHGGVEHRDVHNLYGFYMTMATAAGHALLRPGRRPFILSRSGRRPPLSSFGGECGRGREGERER